MKHYDKLVFEIGAPGRSGVVLPKSINYDSAPYDLAETIPTHLARQTKPELPHASEPEIVRHYTLLSNMNFGVDTGFYPLGSCTMKYNPKINEEVAAIPAFAGAHPLAVDEAVQGPLAVIKETEKALCAITGFDAFTFAPCAGAHGELTGLMVMRQYHRLRGEGETRTKIIVPDSAHGTNPASAAVAGLKVVQVKSLADGTIDIENLKTLLGPDVAGIMMTNPNTLGLFERGIEEIVEAVHGCGALLYYDGANLNPLVGKVRPAEMGFDIMHLNLHKTFSTPHGGGGPGSGPVGVKAYLKGCLPAPYVEVDDEGFYKRVTPEHSLGRVSGFMGNFSVVVKALAYILSLGKEGVALCGPYATLAANYIKECLKDKYLLPIDTICKHEFVFDGLKDKSTGVTTLNIAKRLLDYGFHAPTIYFPLLFHESLMIEPTETESLETMDEFIAVMRKIADEAATEPETVLNAPLTTPISRPDETRAATSLKIQY